MSSDRPTYVGRGFKLLQRGGSQVRDCHRPTYVGRGFKLAHVFAKFRSSYRPTYVGRGFKRYKAP